MFGSNFGLAALDGAVDGLNDAFGDLEGFGMLKGAGKIALPVFAGAGLSFGTTYALGKLAEGKPAEDLVSSLAAKKWWIGAGVAVLGGLAMWKFVGQTEGIVTAAAGVATSLVGMGIEKLGEAPAAPASTEAYVTSKPQAMFGRYVTEAPQNVFNRYVTEKPSGLFEGTVIDPSLRGMVDMPRSTGALNPGIFG